jgi:hypothetical protein
MPNRRTEDNAQSQRFIDTARELGCDEDEAAFEEKLKRIAMAKPTMKNEPKPKRRATAPSDRSK